MQSQLKKEFSQREDAAGSCSKQDASKTSSTKERRKIKNRQHAANSRFRKAQYRQRLQSTVAQLEREVQELRQICAEQSQKEDEPSRARISSLSLCGEGEALLDNDLGADLEVDTLWEDIDGMTSALDKELPLDEFPGVDSPRSLATGPGITGVLSSIPSNIFDAEISAGAPLSPLTPLSMVTPAAFRRFSSVDEYFSEFPLNGTEFEVRVPQRRRPSTGSDDSSCSATSTTTSHSYGSGSSDSLSDSRNDSDDQSDESKPGAEAPSHSKPKVDVPEVTTTKCRATIEERLETYLSAEAWETMKQQLKVSKDVLDKSAISSWKRKRSKGMKLARNRRYGSRRRAREKNEANELEQKIEKLKQERQELTTRLAERVTGGAVPLGARTSSSEGRLPCGYKRRAPLSDRVDELTTNSQRCEDSHGPQRMTFINPRMIEKLPSLEPLPTSWDDAPIRKSARLDAPITVADEPTPVYAGTAYRLFAIVAVAVVGTCVFQEDEDSTAQLASQSTPGRILSACYVLKMQQIVAFMESWPVVTVLSILASIVFAVGFAIAAGSRERTYKAAQSKFKRRMRTLAKPLPVL